MKKLKGLKENSTIGIIAPASPESKEFINEKIDLFKKLGFKVKQGSHLYNSYGYLAGNDKDRADDLNSMFADREIDAIVCFRGGYGSIRIVPYLNLKVIRNNPKAFCGYSDITLLLNYINKTCNFTTFHSPMINSDFTDSITKDYFLNVLKNNNNNEIQYNLKELCNNGYFILNNRDFEGNIVGGNLSIICSSIGTPYEIKFKNNILLLEDIGESPYSVDRMLSQLIFSGKLQQTSGIILGHFTNCVNKPTDFSIDEVLKEKFSSLKMPIIYNFPIGHDYPNITMPIGTKFKFFSHSNLLIQKTNIF